MLRLKPLVFISTISYMLYLLHNNLGCVFIYHVNQAGLSPLASMILGIVFTIVVSALITFLSRATGNQILASMLVALERTSPATNWNNICGKFVIESKLAI